MKPHFCFRGAPLDLVIFDLRLLMRPLDSRHILCALFIHLLNNIMSILQHLHQSLLVKRRTIAKVVDYGQDKCTRSVPDKSKSRKHTLWDILKDTSTFTIWFLRLLSFLLFLLPGSVVFVWHYLTYDRLAVYYGGNDMFTDNPTVADDKGRGRCKCPFFSRRHYLDIYGSRTTTQRSSSLDQKKRNKKPVVVFIGGGAWIIGYRMWSTLIARALVPFGILVVIPDYRNYPSVNINGMVQDIDLSIQWTFDNIERYGGDKEKVVLVGQSAGAHIGGVVVARKVLDWFRKEKRLITSEQESDNEQVDMQSLKSTYLPNQLCGFISTSTPFNLVTMSPVFHRHGLSASIQANIFGGQSDNQEDIFEESSPYHLMLKAHNEYTSWLQMSKGESYGQLELKEVFPRLCVIHGTADKTVSPIPLCTLTTTHYADSYNGFVEQGPCE